MYQPQTSMTLLEVDHT